MDEEHKKNLEKRLASINVNYHVEESASKSEPGRRILFASDEYAAPVWCVCVCVCVYVCECVCLCV